MIPLPSPSSLRFLLISGSFLALLPSCSDPGTPGTRPSPSPTRPLVLTTNYPVTYFAQRIAGDLVDLHFPAPPDGDPAFWQPTPEKISAYQSATLVLLNGATYEKWLEKVSLPASILSDTSAPFSGAFIETKDATTHSHGKEGEHSHAGTAFTTWLDFTQAKQQADAVRAALAKLLPDALEDLNRNAAALQKDLDDLDSSLSNAARAIGDRPLVASHPVYQYLARRYGLRIESLLWEPETVPDEDGFQDLQNILEHHPAQWMVWEGNPAPESVTKLQELGVQSLIFDPCGNQPEEGDWLSVMRENVANLRAIP